MFKIDQSRAEVIKAVLAAAREGDTADLQRLIGMGLIPKATYDQGLNENHHTE